METNRIHNVECIDGMQKHVADETIDLIIADPPYFKVIGHAWDYQWRTEEDYISWSKLWFSEAARVLRKGGTFYLFGYFRMLSLLLTHLEAVGIKLRQQIIVDKGIKAVSGRATKNYKLFPNVTESILLLYKDPKPFVRDLLKKRQIELGLSSKEINEKLGVKSNGGGMWSIYTGDNICEQLPTLEFWNKLQTILNFEYPYEKLSQTFNPQMGVTDVWTDINFYEEKNRIHPTQKPQKLLNRLILTSSNKDDAVVDPFMGGGSTAVSCIATGRKYIGFEIDNIYYKKSLQRINNVSNEQGQLHLEL